MSGRPFVLEEASWKQIESQAYQVAILPWGATEAHNYHLPYGTDAFEAKLIAEKAAGLAWQRGARVIALPVVPFGVNTGQLDIPLTINMNPSTQLAVLRDIIESLEIQGVPKLVLLNGHGGNDFKQMIRELQGATDVFICTLNWYTCVDPASFFEIPGDHGGELETSIMLHLRPDLVNLADAGPGEVKPFRLNALREGWAWAPRDWRRVTADTGSGDPARATADHGEKYFKAVTEKISGFLVELADADPHKLYEGE